MALQMDPVPVTVVVPCYNEQGRLSASEFLRLAGLDGVRVLFVNDGSTDGTQAALDEICGASGGRATAMALERNSGKAEAVRRGLLEAMAGGALLVGYLDADLATPVDEVQRLLGEARSSEAEVVMGARVPLSGRSVDRTPLRNVLGRIFASLASLALRSRFYDTQCGAKIFRSSAALRAALEEPFASRWAFDVELLGRLLSGSDAAAAVPAERILEVPLHTWVDVGGSKITPGGALRMGTDLARIAARVRLR